MDTLKLNAWCREPEIGDSRRNAPYFILVGPGNWCHRPESETMIKDIT